MTERDRERIINSFEFIRRECGLLRSPLPTIRECSVQIIEEICRSELQLIRHEPFPSKSAHGN